MIQNIFTCILAGLKNAANTGACPGFLKGGGSNISWFPKKRSSDFKRGVQWSDGGTTNLAYLDAKEWTNIYFEPLISVKCCP